MSIVWSVQILAIFGFEIYKNWKSSENRVCHGNGEEIQQIFTFIFITQYKLEWAKFQKNIFFYFQAILEGVRFSQRVTHDL